MKIANSCEDSRLTGRMSTLEDRTTQPVATDILQLGGGPGRPGWLIVDAALITAHGKILGFLPAELMPGGLAPQ